MTDLSSNVALTRGFATLEFRGNECDHATQKYRNAIEACIAAASAPVCLSECVDTSC